MTLTVALALAACARDASPTAGRARDVAAASRAASSAAGTACADGPRATRIGGADRIATAARLAESGWPDGARTVVLASARTFPDALAATPWAAAEGAPILLTDPDALPAAVAEALRALGTERVVIVGGTAAVSQDVADEVAEAGHVVSRLAGDDRFATAAAIARDLHEQVDEAVVVTGRAFADAVAAGPLVFAGARPPVLLTEAEALPPATTDALERHGVKRVVVIGGPAAVSDRVLDDLQRRGIETRRIAGADRFETSAAVVDEAVTRHGAGPAVTVVTGAGFPDALAANAYAARTGATVLLVDDDDLIDHPGTTDVLARYGDGWMCTAVIGGPAAVGVRVAEQVTSHTGALPPDGDPALLAAGDIASCGLDADRATAALLDDRPGTVLTLGDNAYNDGSAAQYRDCYMPTWGRHLTRTRAALGNHDIRTADGGPTYDLFGARAGVHGEGWHRFDLGPRWRVLVLNANCPQTVACDETSPQYAWMREQLEQVGDRHVIVASHHPRWSSGVYAPGEARVDALWRLAAAHGVDLWLAGHEHGYERFAPKDATGSADVAGVQQLTAGTGGASLRPFGDPQPGSQVTIEAHGVLQLTLRADGYAWQFVDVAGAVRDQGTRRLP